MVPPPHHPPAPSISVVIPLYNKEQTIARALNSVLNQTFQDFEIIVVNDGSTDTSADVVRQFSDSRIRIIEQPNGGVSAARNAGIAAASNDVVALLDADDEWKHGFLETIQDLRREFPEAAVWATNYEFVRSDGSTSATRIRGLPAWPWRGVFPDYFAVAAVSDPPLHSSALAVKRSALSAIGGFPSGVRSGEDLLTWARVAARGPIAYDSGSHARFYAPSHTGERPGRFEGETNEVAAKLHELIAILPSEFHESLMKYIALWHTMRAAVMIERGAGRIAAREVVEAMRLSQPTLKLLALISLAFLPQKFSSRALLRIRRTRASTF